MIKVSRFKPLLTAFADIRLQAAAGIWDGKTITRYFNACQWYMEAYECNIIFMREEGYHSSGWWKNPDYERCYHLSISFPGGRNKKALEAVLKGLFKNNTHLLWEEPPYSEAGKSAEVWHYRLFCDLIWEPVKPRGEVYSTQFTERGWKSFSEVQATSKL